MLCCLEASLERELAWPLALSVGAVVVGAWVGNALLWDLGLLA